LQALFHNINGYQNTATGKNALFTNTNGANNTANGYQALFTNTQGVGNTANGAGALFGNTTGSGNTGIGTGALSSNTGSQNVALGQYAGLNATTGSNNVYIGAGMQGVAGESNACYIGSIFNQLASQGTQVFVNSNGKLGTTPSSRRFKDDIKPMDNSSDVILALKPVTFHYKKDPKGIPQFGLVAEDVEAVNPDLVVRDKEGNVNTVRYEAINAMLLNEFLKEHKTVEDQGRELQEQRTTIGELKTTVAKQAGVIAQQQKGMDILSAQIQAVSAELEVRKSTPRMAGNNP